MRRSRCALEKAEYDRVAAYDGAHVDRDCRPVQRRGDRNEPPAMRVAGIRHPGGDVELIDVARPGPLAGDEVLFQVRAAGVGNRDEFIRTGA